jgi:hypothetical protein
MWLKGMCVSFLAVLADLVREDWRLLKPKMHIVSCDDPAPDDPDFEHDVLCEHRSLSLDTTTRRRIPVEVCHILPPMCQD